MSLIARSFLFSSSRRPLTRIDRLPVVAPSNLLRLFSSDDVADFQTGTVKFYVRAKAYGFIVSDKDKQDVWIHRTGIASPVSAEEYPMRPYLIKQERVRFKQHPPEEEGKPPRATEVTYENGREIPVFRKNYLGNVDKAANARLGESVREICKDQDTSNDDKFSKIQEAIAEAESVIDDAANKFSQLGPTYKNEEL